MPMFHAYCKNTIEHAKLANEVAKSMNKTLKPSLRAKFTATFYDGSGDYYYFVNPIRVVRFLVYDSGFAVNRYMGEYRRDYVYSDDEYNRDILVGRAILARSRAKEIAIYKKSFFRHLYNERDRYKFDGVYINDAQGGVAMIKAGTKTGDIENIDNRECFLIKVKDDHDDYSFWAIAID